MGKQGLASFKASVAGGVQGCLHRATWHSRTYVIRWLYGEFHDFSLQGFWILGIGLRVSLGCSRFLALLFSWATAQKLLQRCPGSNELKTHLRFSPLGFTGVGVLSDSEGTEAATPAQESSGLRGAVKCGNLPSAVSIQQSPASHA